MFVQSKIEPDLVAFCVGFSAISIAIRQKVQPCVSFKISVAVSELPVPEFFDLAAEPNTGQPSLAIVISIRADELREYIDQLDVPRQLLPAEFPIKGEGIVLVNEVAIGVPGVGTGTLRT